MPSDRCYWCKAEIDPETCNCGEPMDGGYHDNHLPIPMGCRCHEHDGPDDVGDTTGDATDDHHRAVEARRLK